MILWDWLSLSCWGFGDLSAALRTQFWICEAKIEPSSNRWVMIAINHLTRYMASSSLPTGSSAEIANLFLNDTCDDSLLQDIFAACSVTRRFTSRYHPQSYSLTVFSPALTDMLSFSVSAQHANWNTFLSYVTFAYNTAVQSTTGYSPFRLMFGKEAVFSLDTVCRYAPPSDNLTLADTTCHSEECRRIAWLSMFVAEVSPKLRYDECHRQVVYSEGIWCGSEYLHWKQDFLGNLLASVSVYIVSCAHYHQQCTWWNLLTVLQIADAALPNLSMFPTWSCMLCGDPSLLMLHNILRHL